MDGDCLCKNLVVKEIKSVKIYKDGVLIDEWKNVTHQGYIFFVFFCIKATCGKWIK